MGRVFEVKKFSGRKHLNQAPARRVIFCPSLVSRASQPSAFNLSRNSSLFRKSFASLACARASASFATSSGNSSSESNDLVTSNGVNQKWRLSLSKLSTVLIRLHQ